MEIVQSNEAFKTIEGKFQFAYVCYFVRQNGVLYHGKWKHRFSAPDTLEDLEEVEQVKTEDRGPEVRPEWSIYSGSPPEVHVKTPSLFAYLEGVDIENKIRREVEACEILKQNPHPNIAVYCGCQVTHGRISGLCFKKYTSTLLEKVNPGHLNKRMFRASGRELVNDSVKASLEGILEGIRHIHSLGLVHNDINPANIMFDQDGTPVIIDFDSCRRVGESLLGTGAGATHEWHDPDVELSLVKNDLDAFEEMKTWLVGCSDDGFLFE